jgi:hypothetical protein
LDRFSNGRHRPPEVVPATAAVVRMAKEIQSASFSRLIYFTHEQARGGRSQWTSGC